MASPVQQEVIPLKLNRGELEVRDARDDVIAAKQLVRERYGLSYAQVDELWELVVVDEPDVAFLADALEEVAEHTYGRRTAPGKVGAARGTARDLASCPRVY